MKRPNCPKCSKAWSGIVGPGGSTTVVPMEENVGYLWIPQEVMHYNVGKDRTKITKFLAYTCPKCGYTELYVE